MSGNNVDKVFLCHNIGAVESLKLVSTLRTLCLNGSANSKARQASGGGGGWRRGRRCGMQMLELHCVYGVITTQMPKGYIDTHRDASRTKRGPPITCIMSSYDYYCRILYTLVQTHSDQNQDCHPN